MTYEEAIKILIELKPIPVDGFKIIAKAYDLAIKALEKQEPKKPRYVDTRFRHHGRKISDGSSLDECYECPNCNSHIFHVFDSEKCCKYCGQALDWSDNE